MKFTISYMKNGTSKFVNVEADRVVVSWHESVTVKTVTDAGNAIGAVITPKKSCAKRTDVSTS